MDSIISKPVQAITATVLDVTASVIPMSTTTEPPVRYTKRKNLKKRKADFNIYFRLFLPQLLHLLPLLRPRPLLRPLLLLLLFPLVMV